MQHCPLLMAKLALIDPVDTITLFDLSPIRERFYSWAPGSQLQKVQTWNFHQNLHICASWPYSLDLGWQLICFCFVLGRQHTVRAAGDLEGGAARELEESMDGARTAIPRACARRPALSRRSQ